MLNAELALFCQATGNALQTMHDKQRIDSQHLERR